MSGIEKARADLKISGYIHPTTSSSSKSVYKSFNTESKDDYHSSTSKSTYATFTEKDSISLSTCPTCGQEALYECKCKYKDKQCSKGHVWHINTKGTIQLGDPHD